MSDEAVQRLKREVLRMGLDPAQVALELLWDAATATRYFHVRHRKTGRYMTRHGDFQPKEKCTPRVFTHRAHAHNSLKKTVGQLQDRNYRAGESYREFRRREFEHAYQACKDYEVVEFATVELSARQVQLKERR